MHPLHFKVPRLKEETIRVECWDLENFFEPIHFHEEFQITLILEGGGSLFVSDSVIQFKKGEVYLFGKKIFLMYLEIVGMNIKLMVRKRQGQSLFSLTRTF